MLLMGPCMVPHKLDDTDFLIKNPTARWTLYIGLLLFVLILTISRLQFPCIAKLVDGVLSSKILAWRQVILKLCVLAAVVMLVFTFEDLYLQSGTIASQACALLVVSFGNFQIPAAVVRVVLATLRLHSADMKVSHPKDSEINLVPSLNIFYGIVLGQGILYILACLLEVFSFIPRRSLIRRAGFRGKLGTEYVNLYYAYAFVKCMRGAVLAAKKISFVNFALDSLNSSDSSTRKKLYGVKVLHIFLTKESFQAETIQKLTASTQTMASLFSMLGWTSNGDEDIRLFAAKVIAELAGSLRVVPISGAMQLVTSLLDNPNHQPKISDSQDTPILNYLKQMAMYCLIPVDEPSDSNEQNSRIVRCWKRMTKCWSIPEEEPSKDQDFLPVQGLIILERLASFDSENCMEISRSTSLISKVIDFTSYSYRNHIASINESHIDQIRLLPDLSLRVLTRLASAKGKLGVTLRQQILEHPFLLTNLAEFLDDSGINSHELTELAAEILKNLAMDRSASEDIGHIRVIISSLMHAFLSRDASSSTNSNRSLRKIAGQALAMLAMGSANNCLVMLMEPGYVFIKELTTIIHGDRYKCTAASLLGNICDHAQSELSNSDLRELSYILREVLERIMRAEGAELEVLIGLSSQICKVIPEDFARELEHGQIKEIFVERLVNALNANMKPSAHCPGIRRVIVEHAIYLMEWNSRYANDFHKCRMVEALSMVERTPSRAENYRLFSGDAGLMEHVKPLSSLVTRAKELMGRE